MRTCIIIPMYNEERMAHACLSSVLPYVRDLSNTQLVVVDDGSTDKTSHVLEPFHRENSDVLDVVQHEQNKGYGAALCTGVSYAREHGFDSVIFMDSDLTNHPKYLRALYDKLHEGYEYVKATRYAQGGGTEGVPWKARVFSRVGNIVARFLFGVPLSDCTNGFRAASVSLFDGVTLNENGFAIIMEELYHIASKRPRYAEVPYVLTSRQEGQGTSSFAYTSQTIKRYLSYALSFAFRRLRERVGFTQRTSKDDLSVL